MSIINDHNDRIRSLGQLGVDATVIAGLLQAAAALARGCDGPRESHFVRAISELHRSLGAMDRSSGTYRKLLSRWERLAIEFCKFCGLAQNQPAGAIENLFWDVLLSVEKSVGREP